jgi:hypothetical protein
MVVDGSSEDDIEDYDAVEIPDSDAVPREDWGPTERRAELLQRIHEAGHPRALNQTELGDEFANPAASKDGAVRLLKSLWRLGSRPRPRGGPATDGRDDVAATRERKQTS